MKPLILRAGPPRSIEGFAVAWPRLVTAVTPLTEAEHPYLAAIARYSNLGGIPDGIVALALDLAADAAFERLLDVVHGLPVLQPGLAARLLAGTEAAAALHAFAVDPGALAARVEAAHFAYLSPFHLEGTLAEDLYHYGMYEFFHQHHAAHEARALARQFLAATVGDDLEAVVPLTTRRAWGDWFDPHSCSDRSWVLIGRHARRAWLLAFSHSD